MTAFAEFVAIFMQETPSGSLVDEFKLLEPLRPAIPRLAIIPAHPSASQAAIDAMPSWAIVDPEAELSPQLFDTHSFDFDSVLHETNTFGSRSGNSTDLNPADYHARSQNQIDEGSAVLRQALENSISPSSANSDSGGSVPLTLKQLREVKKEGYQGLIRDHQHYLELEAEYLKLNDEDPVGSGKKIDDIPQDAETQRVYIERLYTAMNDHGPQVIDRKRKRVDGDESVELDNPQVAWVKRAPNLDKELACWKVLVATQDAQKGVLGMSLWNDRPRHTKYTTFEGRISKVEDAFMTSKATVDDTMANDFVRRLAAAPEAELSRKKANASNNHMKQEQIEEGRKVLPPRPKKRQTKGAKTATIKNTTANKGTTANESAAGDESSVVHENKATDENKAINDSAGPDDNASTDKKPATDK